MENNLTYTNQVLLKDGRTALSCGFDFHYAIQDKRGNITPVDKKYYNKALKLRK